MLQDNKKITETKEFRWASIVFGAAFILPVLAITHEYYIKMGVSFNFGIDGWVTFLRLYEFPAKVGAAYLAVIGLIGLNHRSGQTKQQIDISNRQIQLASRQIELGSEQNRFMNYFKHLEEFDKYVVKLKSNIKCSGVDVRLAHHAIFPNCMGEANYYAPRETLKHLCKSVANNISLILTYYNEVSGENEKKAYQKTLNGLKTISKLTGEVGDVKIPNYKDQGDNFENSKALVRALVGKFSTLIELLIFDSTINSPKLAVLQDLLIAYGKACKPSGEKQVGPSGLQILNAKNNDIDTETFERSMENLIEHLNLVSESDSLNQP
ncbi:hypothetical protein JKJ11_08585 [Vibrio sp. SCSIO 43133]|uniref:hypothetical protein n=1 Tax=Vibrio sp. SCSIO 43133 TaxID=2802577 RepID=UPI002074D1F7|nr:hypothetical protein [Vibrio sp. SCSIO 43133]USD99046.1 hypothetical protein JKJ11_08585 [Vibrio sp. SCSIO 43133]